MIWIFLTFQTNLGRVTIQIDKVVSEGVYSGLFNLSTDTNREGASRTLEIEITWSNSITNEKETESETRSQAENETHSQSESEPRSQAENEARSQAENEADTKSLHENEAETRSPHENEAETRSQHENENENQSQAENESQSQHENENETQNETQSQNENVNAKESVWNIKRLLFVAFKRRMTSGFGLQLCVYAFIKGPIFVVLERFCCPKRLKNCWIISVEARGANWNCSHKRFGNSEALEFVV